MSDDDLFLTQNTYIEVRTSGSDTDSVLNDILDLEEQGGIISHFNIESDVLSNPLKVTPPQPVNTQANGGEASTSKELPKELSCRFANPMPDNKRKELCKCRFSKKTESKSKWAVRLFEAWLDSRKRIQEDRPDLRFITGDISTMDDDLLDYCLGAFVFEVRKENGDEFRGNTLYEIVVAIQHFLRENGRFVTLMEDSSFEGMRRALDKKMKDLASRGIGIFKRQAGVISIDDEEEMWKRGILGSDNPDKLRNTILYLVGLNFALRGGKEHYNLRYGDNSQFQIDFDDKLGRRFLKYTEDVSKCNPGGVQHRKLSKKSTTAFENLTDPSRCIVKLFEKYVSLRPVNGKCNAFYLRSLNKPRKDVWYADMRVGENTLAKVVKSMCAKADLTGFYSNHSLRASAATRMYDANIPEQVICEKTGHRSEAVRNYKRTSIDQQAHASDIVQGIKRRKSDDSTSCDDKNLDKLNNSEHKSFVTIHKGDISVDIQL